MAAGNRIKVATWADLPPKRIFTVEIEDRLICLVNVDDKIYAVEGRCPHNGTSLAGGIINGMTLFCPQHYWAFNLNDGKVLRPAIDACLHTYTVNIEGDEIFVMVGTAES